MTIRQALDSRVSRRFDQAAPIRSLSHPAMGEMLKLIHEHDIKAADIEKVDVGANHGSFTREASTGSKLLDSAARY